MSAIKLTGLASGLDTASIITELMSIERQPRTRVARRQVAVQGRQDVLRQIDSKLTNVKLAASDLRSVGLWLPAQTITSGNEGVLTARQHGGAAPGGYAVTVSTLASADARTYDWTDAGGDLTLDYKIDGAAQTRTVDLAGKTLDDAVAAINNDDSLPVWAVNVGGRLSLSGRQTGDHATCGFDASGAAVGTLRSSRDGTDATYTIAGDASRYISHINVATNGLPGVELTLKATGTATVNVSTPAADRTQVAAKLRAFASAYNDAVEFVRGKLTEKKVANPKTDTDAKQGALFGDTALSALLTTLRQTIADAGLSDLGVKVAPTGAANSPDALAGKLTFNQKTYDAAWDKSPLDIQGKLGANASTGVSQTLEAMLDHATRAGDGLLDQRVAGAERELTSIKDNLARLDDRLQRRHDLLQKRVSSRFGGEVRA